VRRDNANQPDANNCKLDKEAAYTIAAAIRKQIRPYITQNREKYEAWLKAEQDKGNTNDIR